MSGTGQAGLLPADEVSTSSTSARQLRTLAAKTTRPATVLAANNPTHGAALGGRRQAASRQSGRPVLPAPRSFFAFISLWLRLYRRGADQSPARRSDGPAPRRSAQSPRGTGCRAAGIAAARLSGAEQLHELAGPSGARCARPPAPASYAANVRLQEEIVGGAGAYLASRTSRSRAPSGRFSLSSA